MQHKVKLTVLDKRLYEELSLLYCSSPLCEACPVYNVGDEFIFERYGDRDDYWHMGLNTLTDSMLIPEDEWDTIAGGPTKAHCSELWDSISRYIYTGLQGGAIMRGWMKDERVMIACCSDGTRPVIFKIERLDYKVLYIDGIGCDKCREKIAAALETVPGVIEVSFKEAFTEVFVDGDADDELLKAAVSDCGNYTVTRID